MPRSTKVEVIAELEKRIHTLESNLRVLPYLRKGKLQIMLEIISVWAEELNRLRIRVDSAEKEKRIEKRKRAEKKAKRLGLIKDKKGE